MLSVERRIWSTFWKIDHNLKYPGIGQRKNASRQLRNPNSCNFQKFMTFLILMCEKPNVLMFSSAKDALLYNSKTMEAAIIFTI